MGERCSLICFVFDYLSWFSISVNRTRIVHCFPVPWFVPGKRLKLYGIPGRRRWFQNPTWGRLIFTHSKLVVCKECQKLITRSCCSQSVHLFLLLSCGICYGAKGLCLWWCIELLRASWSMKGRRSSAGRIASGRKMLEILTSMATIQWENCGPEPRAAGTKS